MRPSAAELATNPLVKRFINEHTVMVVIAINAAALFLHGFLPVDTSAAVPRNVQLWGALLSGIDLACLLYFILEMALKLRVLGRKEYFARPWNTFDFVLILLSLPSLLIPLGLGGRFAIFPAFRMLRLLRFLRFMRFIPNLGRLMSGAKRALRASVGILLVLLLYNFIFGLASFHIFGPGALGLPEFADPLTSMYTMFKIFTIEGWYDICDDLCLSLPPLQSHLVRIYFIAAVVTGGLLILGLLNAVFVEEMSSDLARQTEEEVVGMQEELTTMREEVIRRLDQVNEKLARIEDRDAT